ncbi:MAG: hypothetical protein IJ757_07365 [Clostridiales bacterium]|nr:hypothetical protein [Clostridiales bacterium]
MIKRVTGRIPVDIKDYQEPEDGIADLVISKCKVEIAVLYAVGGLLAVVLLVDFYFFNIAAGNGRDILDVIIPVGFFGPIIYFYRSSLRIKILKGYVSRATQRQFKYCSTNVYEEKRNREKKALIVLIEGENLIFDRGYLLESSASAVSMPAKFSQDILVNKVHAASVILLVIALCAGSIAKRNGLITEDFFGSILVMPLAVFIGVLVVAALFIIIRNSDIRYSVYVFCPWVNFEVFGSLYLLFGENEVLRFLVSFVMIALIGFVLWFMNKDLITIGKALCNNEFRQLPATVVRKIGPSNRERIFPVAFGYLTVEVEDQRGNNYKVKVKSSYFDSLSEGDKGTLITLDEDDSKRIFLI